MKLKDVKMQGMRWRDIDGQRVELWNGSVYIPLFGKSTPIVHLPFTMKNENRKMDTRFSFSFFSSGMKNGKWVSILHSSFFICDEKYEMNGQLQKRQKQQPISYSLPAGPQTVVTVTYCYSAYNILTLGKRRYVLGHTLRQVFMKYEGRPINKLQNGIILLIFKI